MRIALIEACDPEWQFKLLYYPLQLGYLVSYLKKYSANIDVVIVKDIEELIRIKPDIAGISSYSMNYDIAKSFAENIKEMLGIPIILGGCHISALPETFLPELFDIGVIGEGEETLRELLLSYKKHGSFAAEHIENINGIIFKSGDKIKRTSPREALEPISKIPPPQREYNRFTGGVQYISTSRGCPFKCTFCAPRMMWQECRYFPAKYVMDEIGQIIMESGGSFSRLVIIDDLFIANKVRLKKLRDLFKSSGLSSILTSNANIRADLIDDETAKILKEMNFTNVNFGAESGSDRILKLYNKKTSVEINQRAIDILYNYGIQTIPSFIIGAPSETEEDLQATIDFIEKNHEKLAGFEVFPLIPMPGSEIWSDALAKGKVNNNIEWSRLEPLLLDFNPERYIYLIESISKEKFLEYVGKFQEIYKKYNPKALELIENLKVLKAAQRKAKEKC